jgi:hypothetical protein
LTGPFLNADSTSPSIILESSSVVVEETPLIVLITGKEGKEKAIEG